MTSGLDFYDIHQHIGDSSGSHAIDWGVQTFDAVGLAESEADTRLRYMDDARIRRALVMPGFSYDRSDGIQATRRQNDSLARYRDAKPERFIAAGIAEPRDTGSARDEIKRISDELGVVGVTFHTAFQGVTMDSRSVMDCIALMGELNLVPLLHAADDCHHESLSKLAKVARAFPDLTIVALEPFYLLEGQLTCDLVAEVAPNVVFDTASCYDFDLLTAFATRWGSDRVLYGSHFYSQDGGSSRSRRAALLRREFETSSVLSEAAKYDIAEGNWKRVFGQRDDSTKET
jgi:uncharacterized protein